MTILYPFGFSYQHPDYNRLTKFRIWFLCIRPLEDSYELKGYLRLMYAYAAQYNDPPNYPVNMVCGGIDGAAFGNDIISKIFAGVVAYGGNMSCYVNPPTNETETSVGFRWQVI